MLRKTNCRPLPHTASLTNPVQSRWLDIGLRYFFGRGSGGGGRGGGGVFLWIKTKRGEEVTNRLDQYPSNSVVVTN